MAASSSHEPARTPNEYYRQTVDQFARLDKSGDGRIMKEEVVRLFVTLNPTWTQDEVEQLIYGSGTLCNDEKVDYKGFLTWVMGNPLPHEREDASGPNRVEHHRITRHTKTADPSLGSKAHRSPAKPPLKVNVWVEEPSRRGMSAGQFYDFFKEFCGEVIFEGPKETRPLCLPSKLSKMCILANQEEAKENKRPWDTNLYFVTDRIIRPETKRKLVSYAELINEGGLDIEFFISHHWAEDFAEFIQTLMRHAQYIWRVFGPTWKKESWKNVVYWCCAFANNQHSVQLGSTLDNSPFAVALKAKSCRGTIMNLNQNVTAVFRIWCVYEMLLSHDLQYDKANEGETDARHSFLICTRNGPLAGDAEPSDALDLWVSHMNGMLEQFDVTKAQASNPRDRDLIMRAVHKYEGRHGAAHGQIGPEALNLTVKAILAKQALFTLARKGDKDGVKKALELKADPNAEDVRGLRALAYGTYADPSKKEGIVNLLLDARADPAAQHGAREAVEMWDPSTKKRARALRQMAASLKKDSVFKIHHASYEMALHRHMELCKELHGGSAHYPKNGGNLCYAPTNYHLKKADKIIEKLVRIEHTKLWPPNCQEEGNLTQVLAEVLKEESGIDMDGVLPSSPPSRPRKRSLMLAISDLEPDDSMAIAQLWQWKKNHNEILGMPLICVPVNFTGNDKGNTLELKLLVGALMLGITDYHVLAPVAGKAAEDSAAQLYKYVHNDGGQVVDGMPDPALASKAKRYKDIHKDVVEEICNKISERKADTIDLYLTAPLHGNLDALVNELNAKNKPEGVGKWRWNIWMYSGSYNMKGMTAADEKALRELMLYSTQPLTDVGKFPFFGGNASHSCTANFNTFARETFTGRLNKCAPLLSAALKIFNDTFNSKLISPKADGLFGRDEKLNDQELSRFKKLAEKFKEGDVPAIRAYATALFEDKDVFEKVANFKKSIVVAFAYDSCDSPLCDQLIFLVQWLQKEMGAVLDDTVGEWRRHEKGFTEVEVSDHKVTQVSPDGIRAIQPKLCDPYDEEVLDQMREALQEFLMKHLEELYPS